MKSRIAILASMSLLASVFAGCASLDVDRYIPQVSADRLEYTRAGNVSSANVVVENLQNGSDAVTADTVAIDIAYPWLPKFQVRIDGYRRDKVTAPPDAP